jgi:hypothetical protein
MGPAQHYSQCSSTHVHSYAGNPDGSCRFFIPSRCRRSYCRSSSSWRAHGGSGRSRLPRLARCVAHHRTHLAHRRGLDSTIVYCLGRTMARGFIGFSAARRATSDVSVLEQRYGSDDSQSIESPETEPLPLRWCQTRTHLAFCWAIHLSVRASSISSGSDPPSRISS